MNWSNAPPCCAAFGGANWIASSFRKNRSMCSPSKSSPQRPAKIGTKRNFSNSFARAWPYRNLTREEFDSVVRMLAEGFSTKRGRRAALIHHDAMNHRIRGRRGARLIALTSGGAIPDNADYRVILEPSRNFRRHGERRFRRRKHGRRYLSARQCVVANSAVNSGVVRVEDAKGQPPGIPFWLGEAPARTAELSQAVSDLRRDRRFCTSPNAPRKV